MGILLCEQNFRDVWIRNKSVRAEIGQILRTHTQTHTHTTAAKLVVRMPLLLSSANQTLPGFNQSAQMIGQSAKTPPSPAQVDPFYTQG